MKFDFLFPVLYSDRDIDYYDALASALEASGHRVALLSLSREAEKRLRRNHEHVFYLYEGWSGQAPSLDEQRAIERRYGVVLTDHVFPEHLYPWGRPLQELVPRAAYTFNYLQRMFDAHDVGMVVNNYGGEIIRRCSARIADAGGPTNVFLDGAPFPGRVSASTSEWDWDDLPRPLPPVDATQRREAEELVARVQREKPSVARGGTKLRLDLSSLRWSAVNFYRAIQSPERLDYSVVRAHVDRAQQILRHGTHRSLPWFTPEPGGEPYIFFPLHVPSDSAISVRAPQFYRQEVLVEYLASRCLPAGLKLYVKPHPDGVSCYSTSLLAQMARMPNVRLVDPGFSAHRLIPHAEAMVVINSSVGLESLYYGKPVVVVGRVFYRGFDLTVDLDDLSGLAAAVARAVGWRPDREGILRFFTATQAATAPGRVQDPTPANITGLCNLIVRKRERLHARRQTSAAG